LFDILLDTFSILNFFKIERLCNKC